MLFNPNATCFVIKNSGYNAYGEAVRDKKQKIKERCAVLNANLSMKKSSVRADSSASRGNAQEAICDYWLILESTTQAEVDDLIEFDDLRLKVVQTIRRYSLSGIHDHTEVYCQLWNEVEDD